jgi:parallel beta-helix repeat protein
MTRRTYRFALIAPMIALTACAHGLEGPTDEESGGSAPSAGSGAGSSGGGGKTNEDTSSSGGSSTEPGASAGIPGCAAPFIDASGVCRPAIEKCPAGSIPQFETGCIPVGIPGCDKTFLESDGVCHVSAAKCATGQIPIPDQGCVSIDGPSGCGAAPWGTIADAPENIYVNPSYTGPAGNGTKNAPLLTLQAALTKATFGSRVVLAAGTYPESVSISKAVEIIGRCPSLVKITGSAAGTALIAISGAPGLVSLRQLQLAAPGAGLLASNGMVNLDALWIRETVSVGIVVSSADVSITRSLLQDIAPGTNGTSGNGINVFNNGKLTMTESAIVRARTQGVSVSGGGAASIKDSLIESTNPQQSDSQYGYAVTATSTTVTIDGSALVGNRLSAVSAYGGGAEATITNSVIEKTLADLKTNTSGVGVTGLSGAVISASGCVLRDNKGSGISLDGGGTSMTLSRTLIQGTQPQPSDQKNGVGVALSKGAKITMTDAALIQNRDAALALFDPLTTAIVTGTLMEGTEVSAFDQTAGAGVFAQSDAKATLDKIAVLSNHSMGVFVANNADVTLSNSLIEDTAANPAGSHGMGLWATKPKALAVRATRILGSRVAGILIQAGPAKIEGSVVRGVELGKIVSDGAPTVDGIGDGLLVVQGGANLAVSVTGSLFADSGRAGVLYANSSGSIQGSVAKGNRYGLVLQGATKPTIDGNNAFTGNKEADRLEAGTLPVP